MLHGHELKQAILQTMFDRFAAWAQSSPCACRPGCAFCCTQNVTVTAVEARMLLDYIALEDMQEWLSARLGAGLPSRKAGLTTNEFARLCLSGDDPQPAEGAFDSVCPFLENNRCMVYPARPFSCRSFVSTIVCSRGGSAVVPPAYLAAATAVSQLIEHLGQFNLWGNLLHVLYVVGCETGMIDAGQNVTTLAAARECCAEARPLPGFLFDASEAEQIVPLIESIFSSTVDGKQVEDILNGR